jgi:hypothetical protein
MISEVCYGFSNPIEEVSMKSNEQDEIYGNCINIAKKNCKN